MSTAKDKQMQEQLLLQKLRKKRKLQNEERSDDKQEIEKKVEETVTSEAKCDDLTKAAIEEICRETKRASERAELVGPSGWLPKTIKKANKRFLNSTMRSVITHNQRTNEKSRMESRKKYDEITRCKPKFGTRSHLFLTSNERLTKREKD